MSSEDFFVLLSVVFKKFGFVFNEFLPVVDCLFHVGIIICVITLSADLSQFHVDLIHSEVIFSIVSLGFHANRPNANQFACAK